MKKLFLMLAAAAVMLAGCTKELEQRVDKLEQAVDELRALVDGLNKDVEDIQTLLDKNAMVASYDEIDGGYKLVLTNGKTIELKHGKNGNNGEAGHSPVIGVKAENGVYYWTVDGEWLLDSAGKKIPTTGENGENGAPGAPGAPGTPGENGADAPTPSFEIVNGELIVTVGETVTNLGQVAGKDGDSWFSGVKKSEDGLTVTITLTEGGEIVLPIQQNFTLTLLENEVPMVMGAEVEVGFVVSGATDPVVRAYASEGWKVKVGENTLTITAPSIPAEADEAAVEAAKILFAAGCIDVYAIDNATGLVKVRTLSFTEGKFTVNTEDVITVSPLGGEVNIAVSTDQTYEASTDAEWLTFVEVAETKAVRNETIKYTVSKNDSGANRTAKVVLKSGNAVLAEFTVNQQAAPTKITLSETEVVLSVGEQHKFAAKVEPQDADAKVVWAVKSADNLPEKLTIDENGLVTANGYYALGTNEFTVTATSVVDNTLKATATVTIVVVNVESIKTNVEEPVTLKIGQLFQVEPTVLPANASSQKVYYTSNNEKVATVDKATGLVTGVAAGEATITIHSDDEFWSNFEVAPPTASFKVTVSNELTVTSIVLPESIDLPIGRSTTVTTTIAPEAASDKSLVWTVEAPNGTPEKLTVDENGVITANDYNIFGENTYYVTATSVDNPLVSATVAVNVIMQNAEEVVLNKKELTLAIGQTETLVATVLPEAAVQDVLWSSSNDNVVKIDQKTGLMTAIAAGEAIITANSNDKYTMQQPPFKTCKVTVTSDYAVTSIVLPEAFELGIGESRALEAIVGPDNATDKSIVWSVEAPNNTPEKLTVDENGVVTANAYNAVADNTYYVVATSASTPNVSAKVAVTVVIKNAEEVVLNKTSMILGIGQTETLTATVLPTGASQDVLWRSSNDKVAKVDQKTGLITAVAAGEAVITADSNDPYATSQPPHADCKITVVAGRVVTSIELPETVEVYAGQSVDLAPVVNPGDAADLTLTWTVSGSATPEKISVSADGVVTANSYNMSGSNEYTVTATSVSNPSVTATTKVVVKALNVTEVVAEKSEITLAVGETRTLTATALPEGSSQAFLFHSSNTSVASVVQSTGVITAKAAGETIITIYSNDPYTMEQPPYTTVKVTVLAAGTVTSISLPETVEVFVGKSVNLNPVVAPENATDKSLTWTVSGSDTPEKISVSADGVVTANSYNMSGSNEYTVTATSKSNPSVSASTKVVVKPINVTSVVVENAEITLSVGETLTLNPTALPEGSSQMFLFSSSNPSVASVVQSTGVITAKAAGETIITIYSNDPYTMEQPPYTTVKVTVIQPVTSITLPETVEVYVGESVSLNPVVAPENASNKALTWKVSGVTSEKISVDNNGVVTANSINNFGSNEYIVTATSVSNPEVSASTKVTVKAYSAESVVLNKTELTLNVGATETLTASVLPAGASQDVLWRSSNEAVAKVDQMTGLITAVAAGEAIITADSNDPTVMTQPPFASCKVTVIQPVTSITLPSETITITEGETVSFAYTVNPENASNKALTWKVSGATPEKLVVTDGQIYADGFNPYMSNEYTVTATSVSNPEVKATMKVVVEQAPLVESVSVDAETITMKVGETFDTSRLTVAPAGASNKTSFRFQAYVYGSWNNTYGYGTPVSGNVITESNGTFTANTPGTYTIGVSMDGLYSVQPPFTSFTLVIEE